MRRLAILIACLAGLGTLLGMNLATSSAAPRAAAGGDPTLTLVVHLVNPGDITPADYTLMAMSPVFSFAGPGGSPNVTEIPVPDATYQLSISGPGGGSPSVWSCLGVDTFTTNSVTLADGDIATCSITITFPPVTTTTTAPATTTTAPPATTVPGAPTTTAPPATTVPGAPTTTPTTSPSVPPTVPGVTPTPPGQTTPGCPECVITGSTTPTGVAATGVPEAPTAPIQSVQPVTG